MIKRFLKYHPIHKKLVSNLDIVFLLRPTLFFSIWVMVVMGMSSAQMNLITYPLWISAISLKTFFAFIGLSFICSSAFILNQIADVSVDEDSDDESGDGEGGDDFGNMDLLRMMQMMGGQPIPRTEEEVVVKKEGESCVGDADIESTEYTESTESKCKGEECVTGDCVDGECKLSTGDEV